MLRRSQSPACCRLPVIAVSTLMIAAILAVIAGGGPAVRAADPSGGAERAAKYYYGGQERRARLLDGLFTELKRSANGGIALALIEQIWLQWHQSGWRDVDDLLSRAKINASEGDYDAALEKFDRLQRLAPEFAEGWNGRATLLYEMGRYRESLAAIEITLKYEPRHFGALAGRGMIYYRLEKFEAALESFEEAMRHNPFIAGQDTILPAIKRKLGIREL